MLNRTSIEEIGQRAIAISGSLQTEESTKQALVLPFISSMGYDIFDPNEVVPEYTADFGTKHGEKVDYAIIRDNETAILIECKKVNDPLDISKASQLGRYFNVTKTRIGILTNGIRYKFYSDLDTENVMDSTPFMELDITSLDNRDFSNLKHFSKSTFDVEQACAAAASLKYINGMKVYLNEAYQQPDEEFVRLLAKAVYGGPLTQSKRETFTQLSRVAFQNFVNDRISSTLQKASDLASNLSEEEDEDDAAMMTDSAPEAGKEGKGIVTTAEEIEAYELVQTILEDTVPPQRVAIKDTRSYCAVLLDNNSRKPIIRFIFHQNIKHIMVMDQRVPSGDKGSKRWGERRTIQEIAAISEYAAEIRANVQAYLDGVEPPVTVPHEHNALTAKS